MANRKDKNFSLLTDHDIYLFKEGTHFRLYEKLGAHMAECDGTKGVFFAVWAPAARQVSVIGDFNSWNPQAAPLTLRNDDSGIWEGFVPQVSRGALYKYHIISKHDNYRVDKGDPFAFRWEAAPGPASVVWDLDYQWGDTSWTRKKRALANSPHSPISIYEVHLGSWKRDPAEPGRLSPVRERAEELVEYVLDMGFTHVEFLPVMEHPFYGSWGYQITGYFAPSRRYGDSGDLMDLVDRLHRAGIGVILDWVPSHFPTDQHGLGYFDGSHLYEHADPRKGFHPDWKSFIFNYGRNEVRSFLASNAFFWLDKYHADGLRVDAVASMLYLDYSRKEGEWIPNENGGHENLDAVSFLQKLNQSVHAEFPDIKMIAEESTSWPGVSRPVETGGLGFDMKWNMGWMHDTLEYMGMDPLYRRYHQNKLSFSIWYAFSENFTLPLSHDEVVHGKGSLFGRMPGDEWQKLANIRLLYGYMYAHPGKKLLFMGSEFAHRLEWNHDTGLDWDLLKNEGHRKLAAWVRDLNRFYREQPALYELDFQKDGFEWIDFHDAESSVISFLRRDRSGGELLVACNFTPVPRYGYRVGVSREGVWAEILNSDSSEYGGSGQGNKEGVVSSPEPFNDKYGHTISLTLPPLAVVGLKARP